MMALKDIPIYLDSLIVYLRIVGDCIANLTPYLYGQKGKHITKKRSFREQRIWFMSTRPNFDTRYAAVLKSHTKWFDVLAGDPPKFIGLRDAIVHYRGGMQIMYRPTDGSEPAKIMPMLFSDYKTLTLDLFTLLQKVMKDLCVFLDRFVVHFNALATKRTGSMLLNLDNPDAILLFRYEADIPSAWLYPKVSRAST